VLGSGQFGEISSPDVRQRISAYYAKLDFIQGQLDYFRSDIQTDALILGPVDGITPVYTADDPVRRRFRYDFALLASNEDFIDVSVTELRNQLVFQRYRRELLNEAEAMCAALSALVDKSCPAGSEASEP